MGVTFNPQYVDQRDTINDVPMYPKHVAVPVVLNAKWTLSNFTIDSSGYLDSSAVAAASYAERWIPGLLQGHLQKLTIVVAATDDDLVVTLGGIAVATISSAGTYIYRIRTTDGDKLKIATTGASTTSSITSVVVEALDPMNLSLIPEVTPRQVD